MMKPKIGYTAGAFVLATLFLASLAAQTKSDLIAPEAMKALDQMGAYLRTLKDFEVRAEITTEDVLTDGQKLQFGNITTLLARMPYKMRVSVEGELKSRCSFTTENHSLFSRAARGTTQPCRRLKQSAS